MDFGLAGKHALVCGGSRGLGYACAASLAREGAIVTIVARREDVLHTALADLQAQTGQKAHGVVADVTTTEGRAAALAAYPHPAILVTNAGGPPFGGFTQHDLTAWNEAVNANMLSAIDLIRTLAPRMAEAGFGRIVNIASAVLKAPDDGLCLSNGARAGLIAAVSGFARTVAHRNVTINTLLPGPFETDRLRSLMATQATQKGITEAQAIEARAANNPCKRVGDASEFGDYCAFLCSTRAGFITAQSLLIDGGEYRGLF